MASKLEELYRDVIMDNAKNPKNKGLLKKPNYQFVHFKNPSCGDDINVEVLIEDGIIKDVRQDGTGCSISMSSASVMSDVLKGQPVSEALTIINEFYTLVKGEEITKEEELGEAVAYAGVSLFPARIKCATLAWKACEQAINEHEKKED